MASCAMRLYADDTLNQAGQGNHEDLGCQLFAIRVWGKRVIMFALRFRMLLAFGYLHVQQTF